MQKHNEHSPPPSGTPNAEGAIIRLLVVASPAVDPELAAALTQVSTATTVVETGAAALAVLASKSFDVAILQTPVMGVDGLWLLQHIRHRFPKTQVVILATQPTVEETKAALQKGALEYLAAPIAGEQLLSTMSHALLLRPQNVEVVALPAGVPRIVGQSTKILRMLERIETVAQSDAPVLIQGESGTGKELVARALHMRSSRKNAPLIAINCAAFPETLLEAELFGHERGAFTGAVKRRDGRFKAADGGTLLLDEVAEMPLAAQAKLLRVLQEGVIEPLGTNTPVKVNVRVISATHRRLKDQIAKGLFREDLYFRLNVLDIQIPALRDRTSDLALLVEHFLRAAVPANVEPPAITSRAWAALASYAFPGNVRELQHAVEHAVVISQGKPIELHHLPHDIVGSFSRPVSSGSDSLKSLDDAIKDFEREYLKRALETTGGKRLETAKLLGISRHNLWVKLKNHGLSED